MTDTPPQELQHFVSKWYSREPEMQFAEVFVSRVEKGLFQVWGALLHELKHTLFELSDTHVTEIKTAWWADEFQRLSMGQPRHPITQALANASQPWSSLSSSLFSVIETSSIRASDTEAAITHLLPFADALIGIEDSLFHAKINSSRELFVVHCLLQRLPLGLSMEDQARIPMHLMARHSINASQLTVGQQNGLLQDWAAELNAVLIDKVAGSLFRATRTRFDQAQLACLGAGKGFMNVSAPKHLWRAWRAAISIPG
jgi:hypothetical protein